MIQIDTDPSKTTGTAKTIYLIALYTKAIWVWDQKTDMRWEIMISAFIS